MPIYLLHVLVDQIALVNIPFVDTIYVSTFSIAKTTVIGNSKVFHQFQRFVSIGIFILIDTIVEIGSQQNVWDQINFLIASRTAQFTFKSL